MLLEGGYLSCVVVFYLGGGAGSCFWQVVLLFWVCLDVAYFGIRRTLVSLISFELFVCFLYVNF